MTDKKKKEEGHGLPAHFPAHEPHAGKPAKPPAPAPELKPAPQAGPSPLRVLFSSVSARFPELKKRLKQANMPEEPYSFIAKTFTQAVILTAIFTLLLLMVLTASSWNPLLVIPLLPILFAAFWWYGMQVPEVRVQQLTREIDKDLVFAGRHMLIELRAGVPLFDSMLNITKDYGEVSKIFSRILERINVGVPADVAMHDVSEEVPSAAMRRVIIQLVNSIRSGSDVAQSLENILDQLSREQVIEIRSYGQKLNPFAMFYMIFGIIVPSLGIALAIILVSFMSVKIGPELLVAMFLVLALVQFIFMTMIESARPRFEV